MRGDVPRTRSVDTEANKAGEVETTAEPSPISQETEEPKHEEAKELKPQSPRRGYRTRESRAD
jgi:hypothetical protein